MPEPPAFLGFFLLCLAKTFSLPLRRRAAKRRKNPVPGGFCAEKRPALHLHNVPKKTGLLIVASVEISKIEKFILKYSLLYAIIHDR